MELVPSFLKVGMFIVSSRAVRDSVEMGVCNLVRG
jgi:hypothetical protein